MRGEVGVVEEAPSASGGQDSSSHREALAPVTVIFENADWQGVFRRSGYLGGAVRTSVVNDNNLVWLSDSIERFGDGLDGALNSRCLPICRNYRADRGGGVQVGAPVQLLGLPLRAPCVTAGRPATG